MYFVLVMILWYMIQLTWMYCVLTVVLWICLLDWLVSDIAPERPVRRTGLAQDDV